MKKSAEITIELIPPIEPQWHRAARSIEEHYLLSVRGGFTFPPETMARAEFERLYPTPRKD